MIATDPLRVNPESNRISNPAAKPPGRPGLPLPLRARRDAARARPAVTPFAFFVLSAPFGIFVVFFVRRILPVVARAKTTLSPVVFFVLFAPFVIFVVFLFAAYFPLSREQKPPCRPLSSSCSSHPS
jgi:hypothetical protein